jgi:hypothetical protein
LPCVCRDLGALVASCAGDVSGSTALAAGSNACTEVVFALAILCGDVLRSRSLSVNSARTVKIPGRTRARRHIDPQDPQFVTAQYGVRRADGKQDANARAAARG